MRLSTVVELFLILLLVAFAAYGRVIERDEVQSRSVRAANSSRQLGIPSISLKQAADSVNRYCTCNENICNCCRDFHIPLVQLKGPGCASLQYLQGDNLALQLSFGDNILTSAVVNGKSPKPVCVPLPGGFTKFCGRIYSIQRDAKNHFKACLGLELQSATELEASLRVSCFRFGPDGLKLRPSEPLPIVEAEASEEDDDDDFFGLGGDDDDDEDDEEDDAPVANSVSGTAANDPEDDGEDDDDDDDILGLGSLFDIITGGDDTTTKRPKVTTEAPLLEFTIPILNKPVTVAPIEPHDPLTASNVVPDSSDDSVTEELSEEPDTVVEEDASAESTDEEVEEVAASAPEEVEELVSEPSNQVTNVAKPNKSTNKVKVTTTQKKKPAASGNAIEEETKKKKKPLKKPIKDEDDDEDLIGEEDLDDDDEDDEFLNDEADKDDEDEDDEGLDEDDDEKVEDDKHEEDEDEKAEEIEDLDDDDDDEEDALISDLVYDEKENGKKGKPVKNENSEEDDDSDYGLGISGFLARKRHARAGRQSRIMKH